MLTIIAWIVFVWMTLWNILFWTTYVRSAVAREPTDWYRTRVEMIVSLALWIIPGVYLFGVF